MSGLDPVPPELEWFVADVSAVVSLSTMEFFESVRGVAPRIAVFDCDGTLWSGDAGSSFMKWSMEAGLVSREVNDAIDDRYRGYLRGEISELAICGEMVQMYQGLRETEMRQAAKTFFRDMIEPNLFAELQELVAELRAHGTEIWAVSSTNDWVIEEGVTRFGIEADRVLAARVRVENGVVTNELIAVPTDEGKVEALRQAGVRAPDAVFGNSVHDAAMLRLGRRSYPVNPSPILVEISAQNNWAVYYPKSVREPAI